MKNLMIVTFSICSFFLMSFAASDSELFRTSLRITVLNELGNIEEGVTVQLYKTQEDYKEETNPVGEPVVTDKKGRATFKDLEPTIYFVSAVKGKMNNHGAGIKTDTLESGKLNKVNLVIE